MKKVFGFILVFCVVMFTEVFAFSDVSEDYWAYEKIEEMYRSGIISGFEDGTFKPGNPITREQAATIIANFFDLVVKDNYTTFVDVQSGYWSENYINLAGQYMPVSENNGAYYFRPFDNATRVEIAEAIVKIIKHDDQAINEEIISNFSDNASFSDNDKKYISIIAEAGIMVGDDKLNFRPNDTITRAEFCALIYNIYLKRDELNEKNNEKIVLTVNGEAVSYDKFDMYFNLQKKMYEAMYGTTDIWLAEMGERSFYDMVKDMTKEGIISNITKVQKAKELGIVLSDEEKALIDEEINSDVSLEICEFYDMSKEELYHINEEGMVIDRLIKDMYNKIDHSEHTHLDITKPVATIKYSARHILLSTEGLSEEEKEQVRLTATDLLEKVKNGEDFAALAKEYTEDGGSKETGGLYEDVSLGEFVTEFEEAALSINDGEIYPELVESAYGYHIIKLESKAETTRELNDNEKMEIMEADVATAMEELVNNAIVEVNEVLYKAI